MTEQDIQNSIRLKLSEMGFYVERTNVGKVKLSDGRWFDCGPPKGSTDLKAYKDGKAYFLEVKVPGGKVRPEQEKFIEQMNTRYGCKAGIVHSVEEAISLVSDRY